MAVSHVYILNSEYGAAFHSAKNAFENGFNRLNDLKATMALMIDGDGTSINHFTYMVAKFGLSSTTDAKALWDECNSLLFKLNTDAQVTNVNAAIKQFFNKFR
jgi:hypothetical protein